MSGPNIVINEPQKSYNNKYSNDEKKNNPKLKNLANHFLLKVELFHQGIKAYSPVMINK
jgi:hypothetical protein